MNENTHYNFYFAAMKQNLKWLRGERRNVPETQAAGLPVQAKVRTPRGMKTQGIPPINPIEVNKRKIIKWNILYFLSFRIYFNEWNYLIKRNEVKRNKNFLIQNLLSQNFWENVWKSIFDLNFKWIWTKQLQLLMIFHENCFLDDNKE